MIYLDSVFAFDVVWDREIQNVSSSHHLELPERTTFESYFNRSSFCIVVFCCYYEKCQRSKAVQLVEVVFGFF